MKKVLFLPLFTMESGHHKTTDAIIEAFQDEFPSILCKKVDFLHFMSPALEKGISRFYINWIKKAPSYYSSFYHHFFSQDSHLIQGIYESIFIEKMEELLVREQPDLIVCTHSFSSYLVGKLKKYRVLTIPVINIYTDFFMNSLWNKNDIDWHFVPSHHVKTELKKTGVPAENIKISGICVNDKITIKKKRKLYNIPVHILVAGGNLGLINEFNLTQGGGPRSSSAEYKVLCGTNSRLYESIKDIQDPSVIPYPYIASQEKMNELYDWADLIITKPGGVTVSEALRKQLPIFLHSVLPGQEEKNVEYLQTRDLVYILHSHLNFEGQIFSFIQNQPVAFKKYKAVQSYLNEIELNTSAEVCRFIEKQILGYGETEHSAYIDTIFHKLYGNLEH
ncbi:glycosyltransferase [Bacillus sp. CECT 9360]|uniref:MGDG synthase family glycosyltransferase n=1 Tax=Bacillus sp. CECT 9360 TaxID=2845821 RepID=UPI001E4A844A|nr:glycosyltransferase [Bacillus sp. CECT 9360]CAH0344247.1 Processive diacylglycerol beta-glucosyltransferase [Bacillus sp. CECT 9360]